MAHLGEFGRELAEVDGELDTFTFHGVEFTVPSAVSALPLMRFAKDQLDVQAEAEVVDAMPTRTDEERAAHDAAYRALTWRIEASMLRYLQGIIGDDQWPAFERTAHRVGAPREELLAVANAVTAAVAARPTVRPTGSPSGPSTSGGSSPGGSPSPDSEALTPRERARAQMDMRPIDDVVKAKKRAARSGPGRRSGA